MKKKRIKISVQFYSLFIMNNRPSHYVELGFKTVNLVKCSNVKEHFHDKTFIPMQSSQLNKRSIKALNGV